MDGKLYASGTTSSPTQINVYDSGNNLANIYAPPPGTALSSSKVHFTIPTSANAGDYYTVELEIATGLSGCIHDLCIGKIVVIAPGVAIKVGGADPATSICYTTNPSTF